MKIIIVDKDSVVQKEIELTDFDLSKSFAQSVVLGEILEIVEGHEND